MNTKIIAMYLPQYHRIPENDRWWGEGYTDWKAVREAKPLFSGHIQPRVPLNDYYYDLSDVEDIRKQVELASRYGIYGLGIYHYWFSSEQILLQKPAELILHEKTLSTHFFFMWDNGSWKRTWSNVKFSNSWAPLYENKGGPEILAELKYGSKEEWKKHFEYLLPFFMDERYIRIEGKPLFGIFNQNNKPEVLKEMFSYWNSLAIENGFNGMAILGKTNTDGVEIADYCFDYEPATHAWNGKTFLQKATRRAYDLVRQRIGKLKTYNYNRVWKRIIKDFSSDPRCIPSAFVRYDDTPRRGKKSSIVVGETPQSFEKNLNRLLELSNQYEKELLLLTAWNEWGEGAFLEPDSIDGYKYLEVVKKCVELTETNQKEG